MVCSSDEFRNRRDRRKSGAAKRKGGKRRSENQPLSKANYYHQIRSNAWTRRPRQYYARNPNVCKICGSREGLQFHHVTYEWLGREIDCDLVPLCEDRPSILYTIIGSSAPDMTTDTDLLIAAAKFDEEAASVMKHAAA